MQYDFTRTWDVMAEWCEILGIKPTAGQRPLREQLVRDPFKLANEKIRFLLALNCGMALFHIRLSRSERQKANPVVAAAIANWGLGWGLVYNKALACLLLLLIFALRHNRRLLATRGLTVTASVYVCTITCCLWQLLR